MIKIKKEEMDEIEFGLCLSKESSYLFANYCVHSSSSSNYDSIKLTWSGHMAKDP